MMKRGAKVASGIGLASALFAFAASDYADVSKNIQAVHAVLGPIFDPLVFLLGGATTIVLLRLTPKAFLRRLFEIPASGLRIFRSRDEAGYHELLQDSLSTARHVRVVGIGNSQFTRADIAATFHKAVDRRAEFRILFLDPAGARVAWRENDEGLEAGTLSLQTSNHIKQLERIVERLEQSFVGAANLIQHACYDQYPSCNMILIDDRMAFLQPYILGAHGRQNPVVLVRRSEHPEIVDFLVHEFDKLWVGPTSVRDESSAGTRASSHRREGPRIVAKPRSGSRASP